MLASMTTKPNVWEMITTYVAENNEKAALQAEIEQKDQSKMLMMIFDSVRLKAKG